MKKKVRVTVEASNAFIKQLSTKNLDAAIEAFNEGMELKRQLGPTEILSMLFLAEAIGIESEDIERMIPSNWKSDISVIHIERRVYDDEGKLIVSEQSSDKSEPS